MALRNGGALRTADSQYQNICCADHVVNTGDSNRPTTPRWMRAFSVYAAFACCLLHGVAQTTEEARRVGEFYAKADGFSGNVIVIRDGRIISNQSYGMAREELGVPNTPQTRFAIGSVSKQFTAAAVLLLQEKGLLSTSDPVAKYYPQTPAGWSGITLRQLLQHTSGIADAVQVWEPVGAPEGEPTPEKVVAQSAEKPLHFMPGSRMEYNNTGYVLLGLIVETVSGQHLADFFQAHFFTPLQMRDTGLATSREIVPRLAIGYDPESDGMKSSIPVPFTSVFAAGSIYSTGDNLSKWMVGLHTGKVLNASSYAEMTNANADGYGYGLNVTEQAGKQDIGHNGKVPGFSSQTDYFPVSRTGIIALSNKLNRRLVSPGQNALETDLIHLATEPNAPIRSLSGEKRIDPSILARYAGTYTVDDPSHALTAVLSVKNRHLVLTAKGKSDATLIARSDREFYVKEWEGEVEFEQAPDGAVTTNIFTLPASARTSMKRTSVASR